MKQSCVNQHFLQLLNQVQFRSDKEDAFNWFILQLFPFFVYDET